MEGGHGEGSAAGLHGVVGIEDQVEQHLGELDLVAPEPQVAAGEIGAHLHMGRPGGGGYGEHLAYQLIGGYILEGERGVFAGQVGQPGDDWVPPAAWASRSSKDLHRVSRTALPCIKDSAGDVGRPAFERIEQCPSGKNIVRR